MIVLGHETVEGHTTLKTRCRLTVINLPNQTSKLVADMRDEALGSQHFSGRNIYKYATPYPV